VTNLARVDRLLTLVATLFLTGCNSSSTNSPACVRSGDVYDCPNSTPSVCPTGSTTEFPPDPCVLGYGTCMTCSLGVAASCSCSDAGPPPGVDAAGPWWICASTGPSCQ